MFKCKHHVMDKDKKNIEIKLDGWIEEYCLVEGLNIRHEGFCCRCGAYVEIFERVRNDALTKWFKTQKLKEGK